jgi:hypothetical protein
MRTFLLWLSASSFVAAIAAAMALGEGEVKTAIVGLCASATLFSFALAFADLDEHSLS